MKKLVAFVSVLAMAVFYAGAEVVTMEVAKNTADNFMSLDSEWQGEGDAQLTLVEEDGVPAYYVVEYEKGGWAVVSAQSSSRPVICYNPTGAYQAPVPMQAVMKANAMRIVDVARQQQDVKHEGWQRIAQRKPAAEPASTPDVAPLITINLNQQEPYNALCPTIDGKRTLVGCVAVGMAQAMMVARYPDAPEGKYTYSANGVGTLSIDYDAEAAYDWDAMYKEDFDEIARLVYHCGVSVNMQYGLDGSGTQTDLVAKALPRNFKYDENFVRFVDRPDSDEEWLSILLDEMMLGRVVVYRGQGEGGGHCWNLDGWKKSTQMVHVNWGWGGYGNSYFDINSMEDKYQGMSFPDLNAAVIGVGAPTTAPYGIKISKTKFVAGTAAGVALADVVISCEDPEAVFEYELKGPKNIAGKHVASPYEVVDGKLMATKTVEDAAAFRDLFMTVTNTNTGESFSKDFKFQIVANDAVESVMSDAMRVYPSVAHDNITIEVPVAGGDYAIYSVAGVQVQAGELAAYKTEVNVSSLVAGTYILRYEHSEGVGVKTFIKK